MSEWNGSKNAKKSTFICVIWVCIVKISVCIISKTHIWRSSTRHAHILCVSVFVIFETKWRDYTSDWDYYNDRDADPTPPDTDADYENMDDAESDDWFDESKEKVGNMDADAFDAALSRMKKLAGAGPLKTVYDPARRVYKNVPHAVQPAQQPKKAR